MYTIVLATKDYNLVLKRLLEQEGYRTISFEKGADVLGFLKWEVPDLVVVDGTLPDMSGFSICKRMGKIKRLSGVPTIVIVERKGERERFEAELVDVNELMTEPLTLENLQTDIMRLLKDYGTPRPAPAAPQEPATSEADLPQRSFQTQTPIPDDEQISVRLGGEERSFENVPVFPGDPEHDAMATHDDLDEVILASEEDIEIATSDDLVFADDDWDNGNGNGNGNHNGNHNS